MAVNVCCLIFSYFSSQILCCCFFLFFLTIASPTAGPLISSSSLFATNVYILYYQSKLEELITLLNGINVTHKGTNNVF